jgi:hypothetical protein
LRLVPTSTSLRDDPRIVAVLELHSVGASSRLAPLATTNDVAPSATTAPVTKRRDEPRLPVTLVTLA